MDWGVVIEIFVFCLLGGVIAGIGAGLFGLGGGLTTVPILNYLLPLAAVPNAALMHCALASSLALIVVNTGAAAWKRWRSGELDIALLRWLMVPLGIGAVIGAAVADLVSTHELRLFFLLVVLNSIRSSVMGLIGSKKGEDAGALPFKRPLAGVMAFITGAAGSLGGTGAGTIMVPFFNRRGFDMKRASAQATGLSVLIGIVGTIGYVIAGLNEVGMPPGSVGYLYLPALLGLGIGGLAASPYGVKLSQRFDEGPLRWIFFILLLVILAAMLLKIFGIT